MEALGNTSACAARVSLILIGGLSDLFYANVLTKTIY
jgi:hypothetical protein